MIICNCLRGCFGNYFNETVQDRREFSSIPASDSSESESKNGSPFDLTPVADGDLPEGPLQLHSGFISPPDSPTKEDEI